MNEHLFKDEILHLIREIDSCPYITQRALSSKLGISLGKTNYLLKELARNDYIQAQVVSDNSGKLRKVKYIITRKGFEEKARLTALIFEKTRKEYEILKKEFQDLAQFK